MKTASGCILLSQTTKRILFQFRAPNKHNNSLWGFWGGSQESNEKPIDTINRELVEEIGFLPELQKIYPIHKMISNNKNFEYYTLLATVKSEFIPTINNESIGYAWVDYNTWPNPLHPGVKLILQNPRIISKIKTIVDLN